MGERERELEKEDPMRLWIERHLGKVMLASIPVVLMALAAWILKIEGDIATIKESRRENAAQWKVLYENRERTQSLEVEVKGYKLAFEILSGQGALNIKLPEYEGAVIEEAQVRPEPKKLPKPRDHQIEDFKREQIQQMAAPNMPPKGE